MGVLDRAVAYSVGLLVLFLLGSTLIMPQFSKAWKYCQALQWNPDEGGALGANCTTPYTNTNSTPVVNETTKHTEEGDTWPVDQDSTAIEGVDYYCLNCDTPGGYRTTVQGLVILVLSLALIGFAIKFLPKRAGI